MKAIDVRFSSGREVLNSYWGHLIGGGLSFPWDDPASPIEEGQPIDLTIQIASLPRFTVRGRFIKRQLERAFVAFDGNGAKDKLLRAAASDEMLDREALESALGDIF